MDRYPTYGSQDLVEYAEARHAEHEDEKSGWAFESPNWLLTMARNNLGRAIKSDDRTETLESMADAHCYLAMAFEVHEGLEPARDLEARDE